MTDPKQLRKDILSCRNKLSAEAISTKSADICKTLLNQQAMIHAKTIFAYVSFRSEVATEELIDQLLAIGKNVTVPITRIAEKRLDPIQITDRLRDLQPGYCGIPEPPEDFCARHMIDPGKIEVIILPGSVFDKRGGRFGYGGGFYDRFVSMVPTATRIGLAFDLQIVEKAPLQPHDELLDMVITESQVIPGQRRK